jgi:hypothetical protein
VCPEHADQTADDERLDHTAERSTEDDGDREADDRT